MWAASAVIGIGLSFALDLPIKEMLITANDGVGLLLLLPWFLGSLLSQQTRAGAMRATVQRTLLGGSHDVMHREAAEIMSGRQWVGTFDTAAAFTGVVVLALDVAARLILGVGWAPFPVL